ncbi:MAG: hypothetical protein FWG68_10845, partial [Defluviitaleaceae bacterium]|nr:hypothetical protein [Defluviitaleaceae bacterium]
RPYKNATRPPDGGQVGANVLGRPSPTCPLHLLYNISIKIYADRSVARFVIICANYSVVYPAFSSGSGRL